MDPKSNYCIGCYFLDHSFGCWVSLQAEMFQASKLYAFLPMACACESAKLWPEFITLQRHTLSKELHTFMEMLKWNITTGEENGIVEVTSIGASKGYQ